MALSDNAHSNLRISVAVDLVAIFLFAVEGAAAAVSGNLDFFGLMVLAFSTALVGGVVRDLLIGQFLRRRSATGVIQPQPSQAPSLYFSCATISN